MEHVPTKAATGVLESSVNGKASHLGVSPLDEHNLKLIDNVHPSDWVNPTPMGKYNLVVIGGGSAGLVAAIGAAGLGAKVALIERQLLGGDCLNTGCVPSKAVIRASRVASEVKHAEEFGVYVSGDVEVNFGEVMARMRQVRASLSPNDSAQRFKDVGIDVYFGDARFTAPDALEVEGTTLEFSKAVIATGSRAFVVPIKGIEEAGYLTNESLFNLTKCPRRLGIVGGGPIGSEMAQAFNRLGSEVTLFETNPQILSREDPDAAAIVQSIFEDEGVNLMLEAKVKEVTIENGAKVIHYERDGETFTKEVDEILLSVGRVPNIDTLNLKAAGVDFHRRGVTVDDYLRTTNPNIYAAGDVGLKYQFTHMADASARLVLQNALYPGPNRKVSDFVIPWVTYTEPEIAHVGMYEHEAKEAGIETDTYKVELSHNDRAVADGETAGFVKVMTKKGSDKILGATIVAAHAGEMLNEITLAITQNIGLSALVHVIHPYPTQAEAIRRAADMYNRTRLTPTLAKLSNTWFNWARR